MPNSQIFIDSFFSEDYNKSIFPKFEDRSEKMMFDFIFRIKTIARRNSQYKMDIIYFHNLGRFDGLFLIKHLTLHHQDLRIKPLIRNYTIYEITVYSKKRLLFRFRDSLHLLPNDLQSLAMNLCPEYGSKGSVDFSKVTLETISSMKETLISYMKQDIHLLGGIMLKFQNLYFIAYQADILDKLTTPSHALSLFRSWFYNDKKHYIHIPDENTDNFIRGGYYGGHTDAYLPYGKDLYYYDVNSLYPYIMREYPMPGGKPVWHSNFENMDLDQIFGFIEAYIECPESIKKPFLPYKDPKTGTLIFPTGTFIGVYYSEELKFARQIGYKIIPLNGYIFEKMESPFIGYVNDLFESRSKAKLEGNDSLSFIYKLLMNSLYGRFGINPESTKTEICDEERSNLFLKTKGIKKFTKIKEDLNMITYINKRGRGGGPSEYYIPKMAAVQISAAITASARIYMYPFISRDDCYYTDTDSIVLGNPLPDEFISSTELGKFKLEDKIKEGVFLAPKSYYYSRYSSEKDVLKYKGAGKEFVTKDWFLEQYREPDRIQTVPIISHFKRDWDSLDIRKEERKFTLRLVDKNKRVRQIENGIWVGSNPININDLRCINKIGRVIIKNLKREKEEKKMKEKKMDKDDSIMKTHTMDPQNEKKNEENEKKNEVNTVKSHFYNEKDNFKENEKPLDNKTKTSDRGRKPSETDPPSHYRSSK
ncbi:LOW QUALITY PROTEIN: DNA polymerase-like [Silene latifolia]|uniref:LOW QUALITY PROTEIN: DNA polymerase-like n=1 Tax=Silene latifolia TaxID=37657 RepID=UPI003D76EDCC